MTGAEKWCAKREKDWSIAHGVSYFGITVQAVEHPSLERRQKRCSLPAEDPIVPAISCQPPHKAWSFTDNNENHP